MFWTVTRGLWTGARYEYWKVDAAVRGCRAAKVGCVPAPVHDLAFLLDAAAKQSRTGSREALGEELAICSSSNHTLLISKSLNPANGESASA